MTRQIGRGPPSGVPGREPAMLAVPLVMEESLPQIADAWHWYELQGLYGSMDTLTRGLFLWYPTKHTGGSWGASFVQHTKLLTRKIQSDFVRL